MRWTDHLDCTIETLASSIGLTVSKNSASPCPSCNTEKRGSSDKRGALGLSRNRLGWECHVCKEKGSLLDLVSMKLYGTKLEAGDSRWPDLRKWFEEKGLLSAEAKVSRDDAPRYPPSGEVRRFWEACHEVAELGAKECSAARRYLEGRGFDASALHDLVRVLPAPKADLYPEWWKESWFETWRLVVRAYDRHGEARSLHARAIRVLDGPKTMWPADFEARGLLMANEAGRELLAGKASRSLKGVLIVEGLTDMLRTHQTLQAFTPELPLAVLAGTSGSWAGLKGLQVPKRCPVYLAVDPDRAGERYAAAIAQLLWPRKLFKLPLADLAAEVGLQGKPDVDALLKGHPERLLELIQRADAGTPIVADDPEGPLEEVSNELVKMAGGKFRPCFTNAFRILEKDPRWASLKMNAMGDVIEWHGRQVLHEAVLTAEAVSWFSRHYGLHFGPDTVKTAIWATAQMRTYHPVRNYLESLTWDGEPRIQRILTECLGCPEDALHQKYLRRFLLSAVARATKPGCKVDTALVFVGTQGSKKSTFFKELFGEAWFADSPIPIGEKDAPIQLASVWGYEAAEMEDLSKKTAEAVKQFLSTSSDLYRGLWERNARPHPRNGVLCGTTNRRQFLTDETGHRRFWPLAIPDDAVIHYTWVSAYRDQLWAEAVWAYKAGMHDGHAADPWWFEREEEQDRAASVEAFVEEDPWEATLASWIVGKGQFTTAEAMKEGLHLDAKEQTQANTRRTSKILRHIGWESITFREYGSVVRRWVRSSGVGLVQTQGPEPDAWRVGA